MQDVLFRRDFLKILFREIRHPKAKCSVNKIEINKPFKNKQVSNLIGMKKNILCIHVYLYLSTYIICIYMYSDKTIADIYGFF